MVKRALISVFDKTGVVELGKELARHDVEILSTGGTARALRDAGVPVVDVSEYTASPEVMGGRVKSLHPRVHGGILMRDTDEDRAELAQLGGGAIDLVVVNLYPFEATVARGASHPETVEQIDIGGPSMIRSAAKNHARVSVVTDPSDYDAVVATLPAGPDTELRARLAAKSFAVTAAYDTAIAAYLSFSGAERSPRPERSESVQGPTPTTPRFAREPHADFVAAGPRVEGFPGSLTLAFEKAYDVRYGENPHQAGAFYVERGAPEGSVGRAESLGAGGKELSFNNLVDVDATLDAVREFERPAAVVVKHTNPCGVAQGESLEAAYRAAREADPQSAFGGIVALNRRCDLATAEAIAETFIECVIAPGFADDALERLRKKSGLRLLATGVVLPPDAPMLHYKRVSGGLVMQERDGTAAGELDAGTVVTQRAPTDEERRALELAWRVCKHVKSNAIVFARTGPEGEATVGIGAGQMSRVLAVEIAAQRAGDAAKGAVMASDAFFPFADGLEAAAAAGITAVVQPGGSKRDDEVIAACEAAGIAMVMTGIRHFKH